MTEPHTPDGQPDVDPRYAQDFVIAREAYAQSADAPYKCVFVDNEHVPHVITADNYEGLERRLVIECCMPHLEEVPDRAAQQRVRTFVDQRNFAAALDAFIGATASGVYPRAVRGQPGPALRPADHGLGARIGVWLRGVRDQFMGRRAAGPPRQPAEVPRAGIRPPRS